MDKQPLNRRARYRVETQAEAKEIALRQLAEGGIEAVSLMAIGKEMGLSGPALYRYFTNRDALLSELILHAYTDLADAITDTAQRNENAKAEERLRSLAERVRTWALAQPHRYLLIYGTPVPGYHAPDDTVSLAQRILLPFMEALSLLPADQPPTNPVSHRAVLEAQLAQNATGQNTTGSLLRLGLVWWARMHGLVSLEVEGHFAAMGFDPALLYSSEIELLINGK